MTDNKITELKMQERRLLWLIERGVAVTKFRKRYRVADQNTVYSGWHDDPLAAIDEAIGNDPS